MVNYMRFDAVAFLKDSKKWAAEKDKLYDELLAITELPAMATDSMGGGGTPGDPVAATAVQLYELEREIDRINTYEQALEYGRSKLTEAQNEVIDVFFFKGGYIPPLIEEYGAKYAFCRSDVYRMRREALDELSRIITCRYGL